MSNRPPDRPDRDVLPKPAAERLLARASELDAVLAEMRARRGKEPGGLVTLPSLLGRWRMVGVVAFLIACAGMVVMQQRASAVAAQAIAARTIEESLLLRCVAPAEAAEIIRPLLSQPWNTIVINPESSPNRVRVRGRTFEISRAKSELAKYEGDGSGACPVPPTEP